MRTLYRCIPHRQVATAVPEVARISLSSFMIWDSAILFESLTPALIQPSIAGWSAMTVAATTGPKRSPLPLSSRPAWGSNHSGWWTSSYPSAGALRDLGLERHRHELLRPLAGYDQLSALVRGDVAVAPPEGVPRVRDVERLPAATAQDRAQPLHLGVVELERVGAQRLGFFLVVLAALGHDGPILAELAPMTRKTSARDALVARRAAFQGGPARLVPGVPAAAALARVALALPDRRERIHAPADAGGDRPALLRRAGWTRSRTSRRSPPRPRRGPEALGGPRLLLARPQPAPAGQDGWRAPGPCRAPRPGGRSFPASDPTPRPRSRASPSASRARAWTATWSGSSPA